MQSNAKILGERFKFLNKDRLSSCTGRALPHLPHPHPSLGAPSKLDLQKQATNQRASVYLYEFLKYCIQYDFS